MKYPSFCLLAVFLLSASLPTGSRAAIPEGYRICPSTDLVYRSGPPVGMKSVTDTVQVYGGPLTVEGRFQDASDPNLPDWQGWTSLDNSVDLSLYWHIDDFYCDNLDPGTPGNHAWWCGDTFESCIEGDPPEGYGNFWIQFLDWRSAAPDTTADVTVRVQAVMNLDSEPTYDFLYLEYVKGLDRTRVRTYDGQQTDVVVDETFVVPVTWLDQGDVHLRWCFRSDGGWSDEDCYWPTAGAAQIDLITVSFDQDGAWVQIGDVEDCEPGSTPAWYPEPETGVGDYAKIWPQLDDIDPCNQNDTAQVAFVDDGVVVPGTGGSTNDTWTYGPGGFVVNNTYPWESRLYHLDNHVESPPISWPTGYEGCVLAFDVWNHLPINSGVFRYWGVMSTQDPAGVDGWTYWKDDNYVYYGENPEYQRSIIDVSEHVPPGATFVKVRLGLLEIVSGWCLNGPSTPAPYYDNVSLKAYEIPGPMITAREIDLPQDAFPASGEIDPMDPAAASVRFDMAMNRDEDMMRIVRHDSICITTEVLRDGAQLQGSPRMHYRLFPNPLFDAGRTSGLPAAGSVEGVNVWLGSGNPQEERWAFDLPDSNFLFPGDVLHIRFSATDEVGGDARTVLMPADTTGFGVGPDDPAYDPLLYPEAFTLRALPSVLDLDPLVQRPLLLWDDSGSDPTRRAWVDGLDLACLDRDLYDIYVTSGPEWRAGNGLGGASTPALLSGYDMIVYAGGDSYYGSLYAPDPGHDAKALVDWLDLDGSPRGLVVTGNNVIRALHEGDVDEAILLDRLDVTYLGETITPLIDDQGSPRAYVDAPGTPMHTMGWLIDTECPEHAFHNATVAATPGVRLAQYLDPGGAPDAYDYSALTLTSYGDHAILTMPYDLRFVDDLTVKAGAGASTLVPMLLSLAGFEGRYGRTARTPGVFSAAVAPNPFNPMTRIFYTAAQRGRLTIDVFNLRGEKVRRLHDAVVEAGPGVVEWNGRDDRGADVASGVYFCRVASGRDREILKVALVR